MQVDVQVMQLTLTGAQPQALDQRCARDSDVLAVFGYVAMQACLTQRSSLRHVYRIVGRSHTIARWTPESKLPVQDFFREYYPDELFPSEKAWLPDIFEPVRLKYMNGPQPPPLQIFLPDQPLPQDATCAYMVGKQQNVAGVWREIFVYRVWRMVHVYRIEELGGRFYRILEYTSDSRYTLREMQPDVSHRKLPWAHWERHGAGHPYEGGREAQQSCVITRDATIDANLSLGVETYIPERLLYGLLPQALFATFAYDFWQDEEDHIRGYPRTDPSGKPINESAAQHVIFVQLARGAHVAFAGERFQQAKPGRDTALTPARALVLRLNRSRLERQRDAVHRGLAIVEAFTAEHALLSQPFEASFDVSKAMASVLRRLGGGHSFGPEITERLDDDLKAFERLLRLVDLAPFRRRRRRHRISEVVLPKLFDAINAYLSDTEASSSATAASDGNGNGNGGGSAAASRQPGKPKKLSESDLQDQELVLLDMLHAPANSFLNSLAKTMSRIENLSYVLAWATFDQNATLADPSAIEQGDLRIVSLPRLKLTFESRNVEGSVRLYSVDHADLFITNERNETTHLLTGIPHSLLLSDSNGKIDVLVPVWKPFRPSVWFEPFSTELVLGRDDARWYPCPRPAILHLPGPRLAELPLFDDPRVGALPPALRYLACQYATVVQLVDTVSSDTSLSNEQSQTLQFMGSDDNSPDEQPDAHACRLKISLVMLDSPISLPWDLSQRWRATCTSWRT